MATELPQPHTAVLTAAGNGPPAVSQLTTSPSRASDRSRSSRLQRALASSAVQLPAERQMGGSTSDPLHEAAAQLPAERQKQTPVPFSERAAVNSGAQAPAGSQKQKSHPASRSSKTPPDPLGEIPFDLLDNDSGHWVLCDGCNTWLQVHPQVRDIYGKTENLPFFCRYLTGQRCKAEPKSCTWTDREMSNWANRQRRKPVEGPRI
mmetsp:Transcript_63661/g.110955  ORF Transcript_63661/g.110955 Transcript_63661/m.110955 type:complete len:206 (+) Transcript_63661:92-709(+)